MFIVHNELDDGWMWVTNVRTEEQGLIVEDLVEEVVSAQYNVWGLLRNINRCSSLWRLYSVACQIWDVIDFLIF